MMLKNNKIKLSLVKGSISYPKNRLYYNSLNYDLNFFYGDLIHLRSSFIIQNKRGFGLNTFI